MFLLQFFMFFMFFTFSFPSLSQGVAKLSPTRSGSAQPRPG